MCSSDLPPPRPAPPRPASLRSFPGLYESIHHRVRGTWESALWAQYIEYKARIAPLPWNEAAVGGEASEADKAAMLRDIAAKSGLSEKQVGLEK